MVAFSFAILYIDCSVKLIPINRMSDAQWLSYHQLRLELRAFAHTDPPAPRFTQEVFRQRTLNIVRQLHGQEYVLFGGKDERAIGWIRFTGVTGDLHLSFDFHHPVIPEGFIRLIAKGLDHRFRTYHYPRAYCMVTQERHKAALRQILPSQEIILLDYELQPARLQQAFVEKWLAVFQESHPGFRFELCIDLPDEVRDDYIRLNTIFQRDLPLGGYRLDSTPWTLESLEKLVTVNAHNGQQFFLLFLLNPEGERIGFTELTAHMETGKCAQGMTGVLADYRGRGLAQALKAEMLRQITTLVPKISVITTHTSPSNLAMRHINETLGFVQRTETVQYTFLAEPTSAYLRLGHEKDAGGKE